MNVIMFLDVVSIKNYWGLIIAINFIFIINTNAQTTKGFKGAKTGEVTPYEMPIEDIETDVLSKKNSIKGLDEIQNNDNLKFTSLEENIETTLDIEQEENIYIVNTITNGYYELDEATFTQGIMVKSLGNNKFAFELFSINEGCYRKIDGIAYYKSEGFGLARTSEGCNLEIIYYPDRIVITESNCSFKCNFSGVYQRK